MSRVAAAEADVVSKSAFARLCNVSPGRVTQWIAEGKLSADALVGSGRWATIRVSVARAQLKQRLDPVQRSGANGLNTKLRSELKPGAKIVPILDDDAIEDRIKAQRLEGLQRANRRLAEEEAVRRGLYTKTDDVELQLGRMAAQMMATFDGALGELATAVAAKFGIPQRDVVHLMRTEFRAIRARASAARREAAEALSALIEEELPPIEPAGGGG